DCVGLVGLCQRPAVAPVRSPGESGNDLSDLVLGAHDVLRFSLWCLSVSGLVRQTGGRSVVRRRRAPWVIAICMYEKYISCDRNETITVANREGIGSRLDQAVEERGTSIAGRQILQHAEGHAPAGPCRGRGQSRPQLDPARQESEHEPEPGAQADG